MISTTTTTLFLTGCASTESQLSSELQKELNTPLYCEEGISCKDMWERATYFVKSNSGFKLQILNDNVIETYNPTSNSPSLAFSISKEPLGDGKYKIWTKAWCNNIFGCQPNHWEAMARAKRYMRTGQK